MLVLHDIGEKETNWKANEEREKGNCCIDFFLVKKYSASQILGEIRRQELQEKVQANLNLLLLQTLRYRIDNGNLAQRKLVVERWVGMHECPLSGVKRESIAIRLKLKKGENNGGHPRCGKSRQGDPKGNLANVRRGR